jgi:FkbM family methyltransferase
MQVLRKAVREYGRRRLAGHGLAFSACKAFLMGYYNTDRDPHRNGEFALIDRLARDPAPAGAPAVFFDVGAHTGEWTRRVLGRFPEARVHAFEVSPAIAERLAAGVTDSRARLNAFGLSDHAGPVALNYYPDYPDNTSLHANDRLAVALQAAETTQGFVRRGDDYCKENAVGYIDYLKVDAEGHDLFVLKGLEEMIGAESVGMIQFEYNQAAIGARVYLRDFYDMLAPAYRIHRITPKGPVAEEYGMFSENFLYSNFLAVLAKRGSRF